MPPIEAISDAGGQILAYIIRRVARATKTTFVTPDESSFQAGFIVYPAGSAIQRHVHKPIERHLTGTSEVLMIREGHCEVDLFTQDKQFVATRELGQGDVLVLLAGGHGFRLTEDTVMLEIKQGPYTGLDEKERF